MNKKTWILSALALGIAILGGCASTDVVLKYSPGSLNSLLEKHPTLVADHTQKDHYYGLSVDGETTLLVSHDYSKTGANDIVIETPLEPFTKAGLDVSKLGEGFKATEKTLQLTGDFGNGTGMKKTITDSLFESVTANRSTLTYHQTLDHYGIKLPKGKFEWAKDSATNDKDIVFVIQAKPLKDLGVRVDQIEGWKLVTMADTDGSNIDVLLKPYSLDK